MPTLEKTNDQLKAQLTNELNLEFLNKKADSCDENYQLQATLQCLKPVREAAKAAQPEITTCELPQAKKCGARYKQMAFLLPFSAVYLMNALSDASPANCAIAMTAGVLAGATGYGLYRAIKVVRHLKC